jgi:hypothetical protein
MDAASIRAKAAALVRRHAGRLGLEEFAVGVMARAIEALPIDDSTAPIPMVLHCPECHLQHIDAPEPAVEFDNGMGTRSDAWTNPPHRSHLCHGCGCIWRPCDQPTDGVHAIGTRGKSDTWPEPCPDCGGHGERFDHARDCDNDHCALAGGVDDCAGQVVQCHCVGPLPASESGGK